MTQQATLASPLGDLTLTEEDGAVTQLSWGGQAGPPCTTLLERAALQLAAYFQGRLTQFDLPLRPVGSAFQQSFLTALCAIPFGETVTYGDLSKTLGRPAQAIGQACGANPIPIIIPCHRVLGGSTLGGFSAPGGVETKVWLLKHEGAAGLLI